MTRQLPNDDEVRAAMDAVLKESEEAGRHPRVSAVEKRLGIPHATFYRNYLHLIEEFKLRTAELRKDRSVTVDLPPTPAETIARLHREKEDARRIIAVYAERIRQLTLENNELHVRVHRLEGVTVLGSRRTRHY
ncbi:hypothetical protein ACIRBZ_44540 [Streptomyces sp. NPDC094038]|uniref:hypothetical protein n=1 Tax=Streptomyces sp. NPDC094038 TaxID=3366055 RepID=UPI00381B4388